jgi:hypothetical protein
MVPLPNLILIRATYRDLEKDRWALIAHEMVHIKQIRHMGFDEFACYYSSELIKKGVVAHP